MSRLSRAATGLALLAACGDPDVQTPSDPSFAAGGNSFRAPSHANAVATSASQISLSWRDNASNESGYEVHRSTTGATGVYSLLEKTGPNVPGHGDQGLSPLTQYCYRVRAYRGTTSITFSAFTNPACATTPAAPVTSVADMWAYTETMTNGYGQVCSDTGSFVFTATGSASFGGTVERTGNCMQLTWFNPEVTEQPGTTHPVQDGTVYGTTVTFVVVMDRSVCRLTTYNGTVSGSPADQITGTASCGWWSGTWRARRRPPVATVSVGPSLGPLVRGNTRQLEATVRAADGLKLVGRTLTWSSSNPAVGSVSQGGLVSGLSVGSSAISVAVEGQSANTLVPVETVTFASISLGWYRSCGLTSTGKAYCWGYDGLNGSYRIGDGVTVPAGVPGGFSFLRLGVGYFHTCGVRTGGAGYCWGKSDNHGFGDGTTARYSATPVPVSGGLAFTEIDADFDLTCGLVASGVPYCWGGVSPTPSSVSASGLSRLEVGGSRACALTASGGVACWYSLTLPPETVIASGSVALAVGGSHNCALDSSGVAWCWGLNQYGQLGGPPTGEVCEVGHPTDPNAPPPTLPCSTTPVLVAGAPPLVSITAGYGHTCGLTQSGAAYCWGYNEDGALGSGGTSGGPIPVPVAGGLVFTSLRAGSFHTCGLANDGAAYCWGVNGNGQLGTGTTTSSAVPLRVVGQS